MEGLLCPACRIALTRITTERGIIWRCEKCDGRAVGLSLLRNAFTPESINPIWLHALHHEGRAGRPCPACARAMIDVPVASATPVNVEVCQLCQMVWFDTGEIQSLTPRPPPFSKTPPLPQKVREALAIAQVNAMAERARDSETGPPDEYWKQIAGYLGLPVPCADMEPGSFPIATVGLAITIVALSIFAFRDLGHVVKDLGLIPEQALRLHGLTFLTSFFLHAGVLHLFGNMYFLLLFGENVEDSLGAWRYLALIFLAAVVGDLAHIAINPHSTIPIIGASGGIAGVIVFYALAFPRERIAFVFRFFWWFRLPAWSVLVLWIGFQVLGVYEQRLGMSAVSSVAHLGGAVVGLVAWLTWRRMLPARPADDYL